MVVPALVAPWRAPVRATLSVEPHGGMQTCPLQPQTNEQIQFPDPRLAQSLFEVQSRVSSQKTTSPQKQSVSPPSARGVQKH